MSRAEISTEQCVEVVKSILYKHLEDYSGGPEARWEKETIYELIQAVIGDIEIEMKTKSKEK